MHTRGLAFASYPLSGPTGVHPPNQLDEVSIPGLVQLIVLGREFHPQSSH